MPVLGWPVTHQKAKKVANTVSAGLYPPWPTLGPKRVRHPAFVSTLPKMKGRPPCPNPGPNTSRPLQPANNTFRTPAKAGNGATYLACYNGRLAFALGPASETNSTLKPGGEVWP